MADAWCASRVGVRPTLGAEALGWNASWGSVCMQMRREVGGLRLTATCKENIKVTATYIFGRVKREGGMSCSKFSNVFKQIEGVRDAMKGMCKGACASFSLSDVRRYIRKTGGFSEVHQVSCNHYPAALRAVVQFLASFINGKPYFPLSTFGVASQPPGAFRHHLGLRPDRKWPYRCSVVGTRAFNFDTCGKQLDPVPHESGLRAR